jgi:hypothetical protein
LSYQSCVNVSRAMRPAPLMSAAYGPGRRKLKRTARYKKPSESSTSAGPKKKSRRVQPRRLLVFPKGPVYRRYLVRGHTPACLSKTT